MRGFSILSLLALLVVPTRTARGQLYMGAGYSSYDLSGTGSTWVAAARYTSRISGPLHTEIGATLFGYNTQFGEATTYLFPEASLVLKPARVDPPVSRSRRRYPGGIRGSRWRRADAAWSRRARSSGQ